MNWLSNISPIIGLFMLLAGIPAFVLLYRATQDLNFSIVITVLYEFVILIGGFMGKVWQKLESKWVEKFAEWIDLTLQTMFSGYRGKYLEYMAYQHRVFDVKGLSTQGPYNLELEKVYVQLGLDPTPAHEASSNPIHLLPERLRSGSHSIWEYITNKNTQRNNYAILGAPGSGKTTLLKHMALTLASTKRQRQKIGALDLLPILLFIRDHASSIKENHTMSLVQLIRDQFADRQAPLPPIGWLEKQIAQGNCLIMLDGLDEVADLQARKHVVNWVDQCMASYGRNQFILTSRPYGYRSNPLANVTVLQVHPFTNQKVEEFVHNWYLANEIMSSQKNDPGVREDARRSAGDLLKRLQSTNTLAELAVNPLLLTMIATVHRYRSSLPGRRVELYAEICEVFLGKRHEARGLTLDLAPAQKIRVLRQLAYSMMERELREIGQADALHIIASPLSAVSPDIKGEQFLENVENTSGLLLELESGRYSFSHLTFQEYLASFHIKETGLEKELLEVVTNPWWRETIRLYCAQTDATQVIAACLNSPSIVAFSLAIECMSEAHEVSPKTREQYEAVIDKGIEDQDPERRRLVAAALLEQRIRQPMHRIDEKTYIDETLVTSAEYQLFVDEMRKQGEYYQPDHWASQKFPKGQAREPILGVRQSDAIAFCEWLTNRKANKWRYRLPAQEEAEKFPMKPLEQSAIGYWVNEEHQFAWLGPIQENARAVDNNALNHLLKSLRYSDPNLAEILDGIRAYKLGSALDLDHAHALVLKNVHSLESELERAHQQVLALQSGFGRGLALDRDRNFGLALDRFLEHCLEQEGDLEYEFHRTIALQSAFDRTDALNRTDDFVNTYTSALALHSSSDADLMLLIDFFTLQERIAGRSPAFEGLRIVKERVNS